MKIRTLILFILFQAAAFSEMTNFNAQTLSPASGFTNSFLSRIIIVDSGDGGRQLKEMFVQYGLEKQGYHIELFVAGETVGEKPLVEVSRIMKTVVRNSLTDINGRIYYCIACNTFTVMGAVEEVKRYSYGLLENIHNPIDRAIQSLMGKMVFKTQKVGVMATSVSLNSNLENSYVNRLYAKGINNVEAYPEQELINAIEENDLQKIHFLVNGIARKVLEDKAEFLILGCTHFTKIVPLLKELLGQEVILIDSNTELFSGFIKDLCLDSSDKKEEFGFFEIAA